MHQTCWTKTISRSCGAATATALPASERLPLRGLSRRHWHTRDQARQDIANWVHTEYNSLHLHSTNNMPSPTEHEQAQAA